MLYPTDDEVREFLKRNMIFGHVAIYEELSDLATGLDLMVTTNDLVRDQHYDDRHGFGKYVIGFRTLSALREFITAALIRDANFNMVVMSPSRAKRLFADNSYFDDPDIMDSLELLRHSPEAR